jgi:23S rRNA pseudouridine2605 synthase
MQRLQKVISSAGITSRRKAEELILTGRVSVNGEIIRELGAKADPAKDIILVDNELISLEEKNKVYFLFNKPRGCVCTTTDPQGRPTVMDYFSEVTERIYPVGRLDYSSEGLLIFTNDGDIAHKLMHPSSNISRTYAVKIRGHMDDSTLTKIREGVNLREGRVEPLKVSRGQKMQNNEWIYLQLKEGKNLEVRRIFSLFGYDVERLRRIAIGPLQIGDLPVGKKRILSLEEIESIISGIAIGSPRKPINKRKLKRHTSRRGF